MKNIVFITAGILPMPPVKGGAVECLIDFILKENIKEKKFNITVISIFDKLANENIKRYNNVNFEYITINTKLKRLYVIFIKIINKVFKCKKSIYGLYFHKVSKKLVNNKFDYVIVENCVELIPYISKKCSNNKILLHIHNDYLNAKIKNAKLIIDNSYKVITVSEFIKKQVITLGRKYEKKICVLKNSTDTNKFNKNLYCDFRRTFRKKNNILEDDVVIMFSGRIDETKGIKELILAFNKIKNSNAKLLVVGSSWYSNNMKTEYVKEVESLSVKIRDKIIFTGFVPFNEMPKIHSVADIAVIPSIWEEPAGLVVIEAMSSGLPIITTNSGGISEYIDENYSIVVNRGENLINDLTNAINILINNKEKRKMFGEKSREYALKYNTKLYFEKFSRILRENNE